MSGRKKKIRIIESDSDTEEKEKFQPSSDTRFGQILDIINDKNFYSSSRSNFNLDINRENKLDKRSPVAKLLDLKLLPDLSNIINSYRKPYIFDELLEKWRRKRFPVTNFKLDSSSLSLRILSEFNYLQWQYYFNVNNVVYKSQTLEGSSIYTVKAGTKLFLPLKKDDNFSGELEEKVSMSDRRNYNLNDDYNFFFSPEMAEFSIIRKFNSYQDIESKKKYQDYLIAEYTTDEDIDLIFNFSTRMDITNRNLRDRKGFLVLIGLPTVRINKGAMTTFTNDKSSRNGKIKLLRINEFNSYLGPNQVYVPSMIISNPNDKLTLTTYYIASSESLIDKYLREMNNLSRDDMKSEYSKERLVLGPMNKLIGTDSIPAYPTGRTIKEVDRLITYMLSTGMSAAIGNKNIFKSYFKEYPNAEITFQYMISRQNLLILLNQIKSMRGS